MGLKLSSRSPRAPFVATIISIGALVMALGGFALAQPGPPANNPNDEVSHLLVTGGPVSSVDPADGAAAIPLSTTTFRQKAGEVLMVSAFADITGVPQGDAFCDLSVAIEGVSPTPGWNFGIYDIFQAARRGDGGDRIGDTVLPAPATDQVIALSARAHEEDVPIGEEEEWGGDCTDDTFTVEVDITLTTLRG